MASRPYCKGRDLDEKDMDDATSGLPHPRVGIAGCGAFVRSFGVELNDPAPFEQERTRRDGGCRLDDTVIRLYELLGLPAAAVVVLSHRRLSPAGGKRALLTVYAREYRPVADLSRRLVAILAAEEVVHDALHDVLWLSDAELPVQVYETPEREFVQTRYSVVEAEAEAEGDEGAGGGTRWRLLRVQEVTRRLAGVAGGGVILRPYDGGTTRTLRHVPFPPLTSPARQARLA